jgi:acyl-CoA reductase-like NAD-dependent aldehyde dehydrogenase
VKTTAPSPTAATGHPAPTLQLPIAGLLAGQRGGAGTVVTASPSTRQKLADMPQASVEDVDHIFLTAARAQKQWTATDPVRRAESFLPGC